MTDKFHLTKFLQLLDLDEELDNNDDKPFHKQLEYATLNLSKEIKENPNLISDEKDDWVIKLIERVRFLVIENNIVLKSEISIKLGFIIKSTLNENRSKDCF